MTDLVDEVRASFEKTRDREAQPDHGPVTLIHEGDLEMAPGFDASRAYYENQLLKITRRGYRHFAGGTRPSNADQLLEQTTEVMMPLLLKVLFSSFSDGVRIGHREDHLVKMCFHYDRVDTLFEDEDFRAASSLMADGFAQNGEVWEFFREYATGGLDHLSHITGFAHNEVEPGKVWDVWLLLGTATVTACYLAGHLMGSGWRERDVLDGIAIASEEGQDGSPGDAD